jgi:hypothetical protein
MNTITARKRHLLSSIFLLSTTFAISGCSALHPLSFEKADPDTFATSAKPEEKGVVVYAIRDIPEGCEIAAEALESRELAASKIPHDAIPTERFAVGRLSKYGICSGQIVSQHDLAPRGIGHSVNVALSDADYYRIRKAADRSGQTEGELVANWIEQKLNAEPNSDEE